MTISIFISKHVLNICLCAAIPTGLRLLQARDVFHSHLKAVIDARNKIQWLDRITLNNFIAMQYK